MALATSRVESLPPSPQPARHGGRVRVAARHSGQALTGHVVGAEVGLDGFLPTNHTNHAKKKSRPKKNLASIRVFRGPLSSARVVGDGFGYIECGIFATLATASPSNSGHIVGAYLAKTMWRH
jgi:hypothetical protein